ncbi:hypothetical protein M0802_007251 [Mischocyttarus mexicanus]|nr:hypothetical protein M0802_007251 [Mischocyttarus mexicanus]
MDYTERYKEISQEKEGEVTDQDDLENEGEDIKLNDQDDQEDQEEEEDDDDDDENEDEDDISSKKTYYKCKYAVENSSRFSLRVMEAMRSLQKHENVLPISSRKEIIDYIANNYNNDGDLNAQVRTSLKQLCTQGFVAEVLNDEYQLIGPFSSTRMLENCECPTNTSKMHTSTPKYNKLKRTFRKKRRQKKSSCRCGKAKENTELELKDTESNSPSSQMNYFNNTILTTPTNKLWKFIRRNNNSLKYPVTEEIGKRNNRKRLISNEDKRKRSVDNIQENFDDDQTFFRKHSPKRVRKMNDNIPVVSESVQKYQETIPASNNQIINNNNISEDNGTTKLENHGHSKSQKLSSRRKTDEEQLELPQTSSGSRVSEQSFKQKKPGLPQKEIPMSRQASNRKVVSKSNTSKSLSTSSTLERNVASNKTRDSSVKKSHSVHNTNAKPTKMYQSTYSEKRGLSTIYIPKPNLIGNSSKEKKNTVKDVTKKTTSNNSESADKNDPQSKIRRRSRTLSSSEVKILHTVMHKENSKQEASKNKEIKTNTIPKQKSTNQDEHDENYYADDFEEYESDFEECTDDEILETSESSSEKDTNLYQSPIELSTKEQQKVVHNTNSHKAEEEDMHDSGHYELAEAKKRAMIIETMITKGQNLPLPLSELQQTINKDYSEDKLFENKSLPLSMDEGFEDTRSGDFTKLPSLSQVALIDFSKTKDNIIKKGTTEKLTKSKSRGKQLLTMIKLNTLSFSLLECAPVPYEEFIRSYGKFYTQQMYTQTGDDRSEAETQTTEILSVNKWTQFPISCSNHRNNKGDVHLFAMEQAGVGSDDNLNPRDIAIPSFDILQLNDFVNRAATVIITLLEERKFGGNIFQNDVQEISESDGFVQFDIDSITFLAGREVTMINYSESSNKVLLTIHAPYEDEIETGQNQKDITDYCIGCVWNICEPSLPTKLFYSASPITACCFHSTNYNVVFAGLDDGSISLWDLKENEIWHHKVNNNINNNDWIIRIPTYTTTGNAEISTHDSKIVAIRTLSKTEEIYTQISKNKFIPTQLCSIDENGHFIIWSVFYNLESIVNDLGLSQWGNIRLIKSQDMFIQLNNNGTITDMHIDNTDSNGLFVATDASEILHSTCFNCRVNPSMYKRHKIAPCGNTSSIEICPFKASYFLIGCTDGTILLYSSNREKPIMQLKHDNYTNKIRVLKWSRSKPSTVYVLNNKSQIYTCNLQNNEMYCISNTSLNKWGEINCMQLCSWKTERDKITQYLVLGTNIGTVLVYKLKKESYCSEKAEFEQELHAFMNYITLL